ncbi:uncharacterized protein MEPE_00756 [Melanopsichium pennsylvanicum]|uniref:Zn(2)-C6 fungal-type domain-containing protein n=2 Tax=Melanopsichium pennsylvanicum TaxID=63383 RepID=A0AAJ5C2Y9_9BASI|nr:c6 transcription factor [Melanopsichium pennsylvanicum 4]SNX82051.1 uncharacterized protein MEPE_00756 [Melanopsichium pennsylvanicum]
MDRPPYYADPRGSAPRLLSSTQGEGARTALERLPPVLSTSHSLPELPFGNSDGPPPLGHTRLPPIKDSENASSYAVHYAYLSTSDRPAFDGARRPSPPSSVPVGMVSADYMHSRRSPGDTAHPPAYIYSHMRHPDTYRQDTRAVHASSHVPHRMHYDAPPSHLRHPSEVEPVTAGTPIKRPRVSLACLACRNRKSRCDGVRPTCKTCTNMKIECKWPEVDFRRAKTGDAARPRKRSPAGSAAQRSPESMEQKPRNLVESSVDVYGRPSSEKVALPPSQSVHIGSTPHTLGNSMASSPLPSRGNRYRTNSDGDREARSTDLSNHANRSPSERHLPPLLAHDSRAGDPYGRCGVLSRPYSSAGMPSSRHDSSAYDCAEQLHQDRRIGNEAQARAVRSLPDSRIQRPNAAATRCKHRVAEIAILARPAGDANRAAVEAHMRRESSLDDLADESTAGERLEQVFAADWEAIGGLSQSARRPFMDVAAGIVGIVELVDASTRRSLSTVTTAHLHIFRLRDGPSSHPDLRHLSIAMNLSCREERELLDSTSSAYDTLSYPIPVDRLPLPLIDGVQRALDKEREKAKNDVDAGRNNVTVRSPVHQVSPPPSDFIPFVRQQDVKPSSRVLNAFFQAYVTAIGNQIPGLDTKAIGARIRDGSISALLANALCAIGASLCERVGERASVSDALSSKVYVERARALIGAALQNPDLEAILALGVMAIRDILMGQMVSSAVIVSSAVRLCMQMDLHRAQPRQPISAASEDGSRDDIAGEDVGKKLIADDVFWMTYCLDRITSIATARPLAIKDRDIDTTFPSTVRNGEPCIFAALVRQLHCMGRLVEVSVSSHAVPAAGGIAERAREQEIAAIGSELVDHYETLPTVLQLSHANLRSAHEKGAALSFLQLHLTHNMALIHRYLLSEAPMTNAEYDNMRGAASEIVEICLLGEELDPTMLADTPLSAVACFLAGCVALSEVEYLDETMQGGASSERSMTGQLEVAKGNLAKLTETLARHAQFWPVARKLVDVLETQKARNTARVSAETVGLLVGQVEAVHVLVRREGRYTETGTSVQIDKVVDLETLRSTLPHLC